MDLDLGTIDLLRAHRRHCQQQVELLEVGFDEMAFVFPYEADHKVPGLSPGTVRTAVRGSSAHHAGKRQLLCRCGAFVGSALGMSRLPEEKGR